MKTDADQFTQHLQKELEFGKEVKLKPPFAELPGGGSPFSGDEAALSNRPSSALAWTLAGPGYSPGQMLMALKGCDFSHLLLWPSEPKNHRQHTSVILLFSEIWDNRNGRNFQPRPK